MAMAILSRRVYTSLLPSQSPLPVGSVLLRSFSKRTRYLEEVGLVDFLKAIGNGVEAHAEKLAADLGDLDQLLITRTLKLKKLGIPCQHFGGGMHLKIGSSLSKDGVD
eukprot:Gb_12725 [translate_table: standard]